MSKKKNEKNVIKLIRKSNELVEARYKFDIWETRVFTKMLTMIRRDDDDFQNYRIYLKDVIKDFQLENNNDAYDRLRAGGMKLMSKIVKVVRTTDEGMVELNTPIVVGVERLVAPNATVEDAKFIDISFHPGMKPFLLSLQSHFTTYDVRNILKLPSSYSIRIYELLKQYQKIGQRRFSVKELKEVIGVIEEIDINGKKKHKDNYPLYGNFKQRVLLKAQKDLKAHTDITFQFDQIKKGRAVHEILFHIFPNTPERNNKSSEPEKNDENIDAFVIEIHEKVKEWVSMGTVKVWAKKYPEKQIVDGVTYTLNQLDAGKDIPNVGGYLQTMVQEEYLINPHEQKKQQIEEQKEKAREQKELKIQLEQSLKTLQSDKLQAEENVIASMLAEKPEIQDTLLENVQQSLFSGYKKELTIEENMNNPMVKASYRNAAKKLFPEAFEEIKSSYEGKIQTLKSRISFM